MFARPRRSLRGPLTLAPRHVNSLAKLEMEISNAYAYGRAISEDSETRWAGFPIVVDGFFEVTKRIEIPAQLQGLDLSGAFGGGLIFYRGARPEDVGIDINGAHTSVSNLRVSVEGTPAAAEARFTVSADYVGFERVFEYGEDGGLFIDCPTESYAHGGLDVFKCFVPDGGIRLGQMSQSRIAACDLRGVESGNDGSSLFALYNTYEANRVREGGLDLGDFASSVRGNIFTTGGDISVKSYGQQVAIAGNPMGGGDIDTSGSSGLNSITGNTNVGTLTVAGSDAVGNNT